MAILTRRILESLPIFELRFFWFVFFAHITTRCLLSLPRDVPSLSQSDNLPVPRNEERNAKRHGKSKSICNTIHETWSIFFNCCFSLERISEFVNSSDLMKRRLGQNIFIGWLTFSISHHQRGFSSNSSLKIYDSNHQKSESKPAFALVVC